MPSSYPPDWIAQSLNAISAPVTPLSVSVMRAWLVSTPISPEANNPLGMPSGSRGGVPYLKTGYAQWQSITGFYTALGMWGMTQAGKRFRRSVSPGGSYEAAWDAVHILHWPAFYTETDYPSKLLDMCGEDFINRVGTAAPSDRKTSGIIGAGRIPGGITTPSRDAVATAYAALRATEAVQANIIGRGV